MTVSRLALLVASVALAGCSWLSPSAELAVTSGPLKARLTSETEWVGSRGLKQVPVGYLTFEGPKGRATVAARCRENAELVEAPGADRLAYRCGGGRWHVVYVGRASAIGLTSCDTYEGSTLDWAKVPSLADAARGLLRCNEEHRFDRSGQTMAERFSNLVAELGALDDGAARVSDLFVQTLELDFSEAQQDGWVDAATHLNRREDPAVRAAVEKVLATSKPPALALARAAELLGPLEPAVQRVALARLAELDPEPPAAGSPTPVNRAITQLLRAAALANDDGASDAACRHLSDHRTEGAARLVLAKTGRPCSALEAEWTQKPCSPRHLCGEAPKQHLCTEAELAPDVDTALAERVLAWRFATGGNDRFEYDRLRFLWALRRGVVTEDVARLNRRLGYAVDSQEQDRACASLDAGVRCPCHRTLQAPFLCGVSPSANELNQQGCVYSIDDAAQRFHPKSPSR